MVIVFPLISTLVLAVRFLITPPTLVWDQVICGSGTANAVQVNVTLCPAEAEMLVGLLMNLGAPIIELHKNYYTYIYMYKTLDIKDSNRQKVDVCKLKAGSYIGAGSRRYRWPPHTHRNWIFAMHINPVKPLWPPHLNAFLRLCT